jgi:hypothetical protein
MKKRNSLCAILFTVLILCPPVVSAIVYQVYPTDIPSGLPSQIKGKYRIIEHDRSRKIWYVYDVQKYTKFIDRQFSEETIKMYPPIYEYVACSDGWYQTSSNKPTENVL